MRLVIALVIWVGAAAGAAAVASAVSHSIKTPSSSASSGSASGSASGSSGTGASGSGSGADPSTVRATDSDSLFRTENLTKALASARGALGAQARVTDFTLYPGYLSIIAAKGGQEVNLDVQMTGRVIRTSSPGTGDNSGSFPLSAAGAGVPQALLGRISRAAHIKPADLHYFILMRDPTDPHGTLQWLVYPQSGTTSDEYFVATSATGTIEAQTSSGRVPLR